MRSKEPIRASQVPSEPTTYLWKPYFTRHGVILLGGDPGTGKTMFLSAIMSAISKGERPSNMPGELMRQGDILYYGREDGNTEMRQRLESMDADLDRIVLMEGEFTIEGDNLDNHLNTYRPILVIFDPLLIYQPDSIDNFKAKDTRKMIGTLRDYAEKYDCAIVSVIHPPKNDDIRLLHRFAGSGGYVQLAREVYYVGFHREDPNKRVVISVKNNAHPGTVDPIVYTLDELTGYDWSGTDPSITQKDVEKAFQLPSQRNDGDLKKALAMIETLLYRCSDMDGFVEGSSGKLVDMYKEATGNNPPLGSIKLGRLLSNRPLREFLEKHDIRYVSPKVRDGYRVYTFKKDEDASEGE